MFVAYLAPTTKTVCVSCVRRQSTLRHSIRCCFVFWLRTDRFESRHNTKIPRQSFFLAALARVGRPQNTAQHNRKRRNGRERKLTKLLDLSLFEVDYYNALKHKMNRSYFFFCSVAFIVGPKYSVKFGAKRVFCWWFGFFILLICWRSRRNWP